MTLRQWVKENKDMLNDDCELYKIDYKKKELHYPNYDSLVRTFKDDEELKKIIISDLQEFLDWTDFLTQDEKASKLYKMKELKEL